MKKENELNYRGLILINLFLLTYGVNFVLLNPVMLSVQYVGSGFGGENFTPQPNLYALGIGCINLILYLFCRGILQKNMKRDGIVMDRAAKIRKFDLMKKWLLFFAAAPVVVDLLMILLNYISGHSAAESFLSSLSFADYDSLILGMLNLIWYFVCSRIQHKLLQA